MTKRILDADALYSLAEKKFRLEPKFGKSVSEYHQTFSLVDLDNLIEELSTPAPEPQESIFDADGWCWDMSLLPKNTNTVVLFYNGFEYCKAMAINSKFNENKIDKEAKAWRPLPKLPTGGNHE